MEFIRIASFLVALTVALGAIPFAQKLQSKVGTEDPMRSLPGVGGYAIVLGLFIATFYVSLIPEIAVGLGKASIIALLLAVVENYATSAWHISKKTQTICRFVVVMAVTLTLLTPPSLLARLYMPHILALLLVLTLLPMSIAWLGAATERKAPCRTSYLFCIMIIGLLLLADHSAFRTDPGPRAWTPIMGVLTPLMGTLLACLIHMSDRPGRPRSIALGHGGHIVLGFALSWAALLIASTTAQPTITAISISLIIASPIFSLAGRLALDHMGRTTVRGDQRHDSKALEWRLSVFQFVSTIALVMIGLALMYLNVYWVAALLTLPVSFLVYTSVLATVQTTNDASQSRSGPALSGDN